MCKGKWFLIFGLVLAIGGCGKAAEADPGNVLPTEEGAGAESREMPDGEETASRGEAAKDSEAVQGRESETYGGDSDTDPAGAEAGEDTGTEAVQGGPFGRISVTLPSGWSFENCPVEENTLLSGDYGIRFAPEGVEEGYIELAYVQFFGVCGTGLESREETIGECPVSVGTYDGHAYWDFICFREPYEGVVALTHSVESWWDEYRDQVWDILETLTFEPDVREGAICIYDPESEISAIGLHFSLKEISPTGATLVYNQYDAQAPTGQLEYGEAFVLEVKKDGAWEEAPVVVEGPYGFDDPAYLISAGGITERELSWEWLYGALGPGEYRIRKEINDFRKTADYDKYEICAVFLLN